MPCHLCKTNTTKWWIDSQLLSFSYEMLFPSHMLVTLKKAKVLKICPSFCLILKRSSVWTICVFSYLMHIFNCHSRLGLLLLLCAISRAERRVLQQVPQPSHRSSHQRFWSGHRHLPSPGQLPHRCQYVSTSHGSSLMSVRCMGVHWCQYIAWEFIDVSTLHGSSLIIWCQYKPWETAVGYYTEICFATA